MPSINIATFNIFMSHAPEAARDVIRQYDLDIVGLQEVDINAARSRGQVLFLLEKWWREAGFWFGDVCAVCLAKSVFRC